MKERLTTFMLFYPNQQICFVELIHTKGKSICICETVCVAHKMELCRPSRNKWPLNTTYSGSNWWHHIRSSVMFVILFRYIKYNNIMHFIIYSHLTIHRRCCVNSIYVNMNIFIEKYLGDESYFHDVLFLWCLCFACKFHALVIFV